MNTAVQGPTPLIPFDVLVEKTLQVRDRIAAVKLRHKEELKLLLEAEAMLDTALLHQLNVTGQQNTKTAAGTAFRVVHEKYSVADPAAFRQWVASTGHTDFFTNAVSKDAIEEYLKAGNQLPPGVKASSHTTVNVRSATAK